MRNSHRTMRHSSWSVFLVPLALPLALFLLPDMAPLEEETPEAPTRQEVILDQEISGSVDGSPSLEPHTPWTARPGHPEPDSLRQAHRSLPSFLKG